VAAAAGVAHLPWAASGTGHTQWPLRHATDQSADRSLGPTYCTQGTLIGPEAISVGGHGHCGLAGCISQQGARHLLQAVAGTPGAYGIHTSEYTTVSLHSSS
jgi:hypothetical protein